MKPTKLTAILLLAALPACAQLEKLTAPQPQQAAGTPGAPPMTVLTDEDVAAMKRNEALPRPVNYDGQRWHHATDAEEASQDAARNDPWARQAPELRAAVEDMPVEWWGTDAPPKPAPRRWWEARKPTPKTHVQVYDDGKGGVTTTPPQKAAATTAPAMNTALPPAGGTTAANTGTSGTPAQITPCTGGSCPSSQK